MNSKADFSPEDAKALAEELEGKQAQLEGVLTQVNQIQEKVLKLSLSENIPDQEEHIRQERQKKKKAQAKKSPPCEPKETFSLSFEPLNAQDWDAIAETDEAKSHKSFLSYYAVIEDEAKKHLSRLFKKVFLNKGEGEDKLSIDLGTYANLIHLSPQELEQAFHLTLQERSKNFQSDGEYSYTKAIEIQKESRFAQKDLAMKIWLARNFAQEIIAMAYLQDCPFSTTGLLFKTFSTLRKKENELQLIDREKNKALFDKKYLNIFFSEEQLEELFKEGLL